MNISSSSLYGASTYASYGSSSASSGSMSSQFAEALLTSMDSDSSGSIDTAEFSSAALALSNSSDESSATEAFSALDSNEDGVISMDELTSSIESMMAQQGPMAAGAPPPPPPPPPQNGGEDTGYTQEELTAISSEVASTDSNLAALFETLSTNFDAADANGDGRITSSEAMAYKESSKEESMGTTQTSEDSLVKNLLAQIIASYANQNSTTTSAINLSA